LPIDIAALKTELQLPAYAQALANGDVGTLAEMLNAVSDAIVIPRGDIGRQKSIEILAPVIITLLQQTANPDPVISGNAKFWLGAYDRLIAPIEIVHTSALLVIGMMDNLRDQGFMTQAQHDEFLTRTGSRCEQMFGAGETVNMADVIESLRP